MQIFLGMVSIFFQIGIIVDDFNYSNPSSSYDRCISTVKGTYHCGYINTGEGIYCGISCIITGILGLAANRKSTACNISVFLVVSIVACLFAATQFIVDYVNVVLVVNWTSPHLLLGLVFLLLASTAVAEGTAAILSFALCCWAYYSGARANRNGQVHYVVRWEQPPILV